MALLLIALLPLLVVAWLVASPFVTEWKRRRIREQPFPVAWRRILLRRVPHYRGLPPSLRRQLEKHVQVFLAEKRFIGCDDLAVTDEMRLTIAAQACLLMLNRKTGYFPKLRQVLVYPAAFVVEKIRPEPSGILAEERQVLSGESWTHGQVILSWEDVRSGTAHPHDGRNVVLHEFAHQLDQEKGYANGAPWLGSRHRYPSWHRVLNHEFTQLHQAIALGQPSLFNPYGATNPAEFFAVVTEVFFEQPRDMAALHPFLYAELRELYRVDPAAWAPATVH